MPKGRKQLKERRDRLWRKNPNCPLCRKRMYLPKTLIDQYGAKSIPREMQYRMATIDHVRTKFDPKRQVREDHITRTRLMCLKCNNGLGNTQYNSLPLEELQSRGGKPTDNWKTKYAKRQAQKKN